MAVLEAVRRRDIDGPAYLQLALTCAVVLGAGVLGGVIGATAQTGRLGFRIPAPRLDRLSPAAGMKRMFSRASLLDALRLCGAAFVVVAVVSIFIRDVVFIGGEGLELPGLVAFVARRVQMNAWAIVLIGALFGTLELASERGRWRKRLRLSTSELKRDLKESDGDPLTRSRRKRVHRSLLSGSVERVREAALIVANPTHVAIAMAYRPPEIAVPTIVVRAVDDMALALRRRANELGIPVVENVALARFLLATTELDEAIPRQTYAVVARIVADVVLAESGR